MPRLVVLYPPPLDVDEFERLFAQEHVPLVHAQMAGMKRLDAARVVRGPRGEGPYHWMAELHFDTIDELHEGITSPGGQRAAGHAMQISTGGPPTMLVVDDPL